MTYKSSQMSICGSVRRNSCQHFQNPGLNTAGPTSTKLGNPGLNTAGRMCRGCGWSNVDETWHLYSMGRGTKFLGSGNLNFSPCATRGTPNLAQSGEMTHPDRGAYCILKYFYLNSRCSMLDKMKRQCNMITGQQITMERRSLSQTHAATVLFLC